MTPHDESARNPATIAKSRLRGDLRAAMAGRRRIEVEELRRLLGALDQAEAVAVATGPYTPRRFGEPGVEVPRRRLSTEDVRAVVCAERDEHRAVAEELTARGRPDAAADHLVRAGILERYLDPA